MHLKQIIPYSFQYNFTVMVDTTQENKTLEVVQTVDKVNKTANVTVEKEIELPVVYEVAEELM